MPLDPSIYQNVGRVNVGASLSSLLDEQRNRDAQNEQRQMSLASLAMQQDAMKQQQTQKRNQELNMMLSNRVQAGEPIETVLPWAIEEGKRIGVMPEVTQRHVQNVYVAATPQERSNLAARQANPELANKLQLENMYQRQASQAAPSAVGKLMQEREALPPNDPRRAIYDAAIKKETERQDNQLVAIVGAGGNPVLVPRAQAVGMQPYAKPSGKGGPMNSEQIAQAEITAQATLDQLQKLYSHPGRQSATGASSFLSMIPATDAKSFSAELQTFQAKAFLDAVQAMKGLGALTEQEGAKLVSSIGALDPTMKEEDFAKNLESVAQEIYDKAKAKGLNVTLPQFAAKSAKQAGGAKFLGFE